MAERVLVRSQWQPEIVLKALRDDRFRKELLRNPKVAIEKELGEKIPARLKINVVEESDNELFVVLPARPAGELSEADLAAVAGGRIRDGLWTRRPGGVFGSIPPDDPTVPA